MMNAGLDLQLRKNRGAPQVFDLTHYLPAASQWSLIGWQLANTDEVELYYHLEGGTGFSLIVKRLAGDGAARSWSIPTLEEALTRAKEHITPLDFARVEFAVQKFR